MNFEDLDKDTRGIIETMCNHTGKTKEQAILALIEFGMVSMIAAVSSDHLFDNKQKKTMKIVFKAVNNDKKMQKTALCYQEYWNLDI